MCLHTARDQASRVDSKLRRRFDKKFRMVIEFTLHYPGLPLVPELAYLTDCCN